ncbi:MAG: ribonuclease Y, partial [Deltaproteobacteria bacterium RBG_19FT_COMBO_43_11]
MLNGSLFVLVILVAVIAGIVIGFVLRQLFAAKKIKLSESLAERIVEESKKEAETIKKEAILQAKENLLKIKADFDRETKDKKNDLDGLEKRIRAKEENLDKRIDSLAQKESNIEDREKSLIKKENAIEEKHHKLDMIMAEQKEKLERIAGISSEEAKKLLIQSMETDAKRDAALVIRKIEDEAKFTADRKSREIIAYSIQRYAGDVVAENTVSAVNLPSEEMKGRIIGREGRNIRAIEAATGIDLIVDDTPEAVVLSSFDPIRREVARISLERLIQDGRIHPGRIEEVVKKVKVEVDQIIRETGEKASFDVGVHDIHPDIINMLGALKYRKSYSQNVLQHSMDVAYLTGMMAAELKMNV